MKEIAVLLKLMNLYAHNAHNLVARIPFFQDHEALASFYAAYDSDYDDVVERQIGLNGSESINLNEIHAQAVQKLMSYPPAMAENSKCFEAILNLEKTLCAQIESTIAAGKMSEGTRQMLGNICDKSEVRQYKIKQRIKK